MDSPVRSVTEHEPWGRSSYPNAAVYGNRRSLRQECRLRRRTQRCIELGAVEFGRIAGEPRLAGLPEPPGNVFHTIFEAAPVALKCVAPIMLGDEFFE